MISVLYVDDERELLEIARLFLEQDGEFQVGISASAQEALDSPSIRSYDAIISDYQMPDMDGIAFLKAVRERFGDIPFILFTGRGREEVVIEAINNGADFYLQKGGDPKAQFAELAHKLRQAVARKQAELLLVESEKRLSDIINFLPDATFAIDRSGHVIAWNRAIEEMTGIAAPDIMGKGNYEYAIPFYGERRPILIDLIFEPNDVIAKKYSHIIHEKDVLIAQTSLPRPQGRQVTLAGKATPLYNRQNEIVGAIESIRDITGLIEAEAGISRAKKDWETIFRAIGHPAFVLDTHNRILDANDATLRATGMSLEALKGKHCFEIFHKTGTDRPPAVCPCEKLKLTGQSETVEMEVEGLGGYYLISCTPVYDADGNLEKVIHIAMDITERRRTQDELKAAYEQLTASQEELRGQFDELAQSEQRIRESESRFRDLADLLPQIIFEMDLDLRVTYVNQFALATIGLTPEDLVQGIYALSFIDPEQHARARTAVEKLVRGEPDDEYEYTVLRKDGSRFPALIYTSTISRSGKLAGFRGVIVNITEQKRAQDDLREREEKFRALFNNANDAIYIHEVLPGESPGRFLEVNDTFCSRLGYTREELLGMTVRDIVSDAHRQKMPGIGALIAETRFYIFYAEHRKKDGSVFPVEVNAHRFTMQGKTVVLSAARDITELRRIDAALREREETVASIFRAAPTGIGMVINRVIVKANDRLCEMTGYTAGELIGTSARFLYPSDEDFEYVGREKYEQIGRSGTGTVETRWKRKDGAIRDILLSSTPVDPSDHGKGVTFTALDITDRKQAEGALRLRDRAIASSINAIVIADMNGMITYVNDAFTRMWGYTVQEATGMPVTILGSSDEEVEKFISQFRTQGYAAGESIARRKDGSPLPVQVSGSLVFDETGKPEAMLSSFIDITDRRRAESELRAAFERVTAAEEELRSHCDELVATQAALQTQQQQLFEIANMVPGVVYQFFARADGTWGLYYVSNRAPEVLGISNDTADFFERFTAHVDPRDRETFLTSINDATKSGSPWDFEGRFIKPTGETIWFQGLSRPIGRGTELVYNGVLLDITNRKHAEVALRENEQKYRALVETTQTGYVIIDSEGHVLDANPEYVRLTGHQSLDEISGRSVIEWTADYDSERNAEAVRQCIKDGFIRNFEIDYTDASGKITPIAINATVLHSGDSVQILTLCRDTSERRKSQYALKESEEKYRTLVEHSQDGVFIVQDERLVFYNRAFSEMTGYNEEELIGRMIPELIAPEDRETVIARHKERVSGKPSPESYEFSVLHKDGTTRVRVRMHAGMGTYKGRPAIIGTFLNVTEDRRREDALRESEAKFRALIDQTFQFIGLMTTDGTLIDANRSALAFAGISESDVINRPFWETPWWSHSADLQAILKDAIKRAADGETVRFEATHPAADGHIAYIDFSIKPVLDPTGRVIYLIPEGRDITERKHAEEALRESEEKYRTLVEHSQDGVVIVQDERLVFVNKTLSAMIGYTEEELLGHSVEEFIAPEHLGGVMARHRERMSGKQVPSSYEYSLLHKDGRTRVATMMNAGTAMFRGRPALIGTFHNVTEERKRDAALRESEERYRNFIANASEGIFRIDFTQPVSIGQPYDQLVQNIADNAVIGEVNAALASMYGLYPEDMIGRPVRNFAPNCGTQMADLLKTSDCRIIEREEQEVSASGEPIYIVESYFGVVQDGNLLRVWGVQRNITDRKRAENALRESEEKYRALVESTSDFIWEIDATGHYTYVSPNMRKILGYEPDEIIGKTPFDLMPPDEASRVAAGFTRFMDARQPFAAMENKNVHKDGTVVSIETSGVPWFAKDGTFAGYRGIDRDITERKRADESLFSSRQMLQAVLDTIPQRVFWKDRNSVFLGCNKPLALDAGFPDPSDIAGKTDYDHASRATADLYRADDRQVMENGQAKINYEEPQVRPDGSKAWLRTSKVPLRDKEGNIIGVLGTYEDITDRKQTEEALRDSEEKFRTIVETTSEWIWETDLAGRHTYSNPAIASILGYLPEEIISRNSFDLMHPEDREKVQEMLPLLIREKKGWRNLVIRWQHKDTSWHYLESNAIPVFNQQGEISGFRGADRDITERRRAEEALQESEKKYKQIFESFVDIYYETDKDGIIRVISPSVFALSGWKPDELIGKSILTLYYYPLDRQVLIERLEHDPAVSGFEVLLKKRDGTPVPVSVNARIRYAASGEPDGILGSIRDITEYVRAHKALQASEGIYRRILENMQDAYFQADEDGNLSMVSPSAARIFGYGSPDDMIGMPASSLYHSIEKREEMIRQLRESGRVSDITGEACRRDGITFWASMNVQHIKDDEGHLEGFEAIVRDITERKTMERAIREANRKLNLLNSITRHDVANQLTVLQGYAQIAAMKESDPVIADFLSKMDMTAQTIARQIEFTKTYQELGVHTPAWFRLDEIIAKVARDEVIFSNTCRQAEVFADPMLERVFFNIFENAIRHGMRVTQIAVRCERAPDGLVIIVEDDGIGIPPEEKENIFTKGYGKNTGFGLFLAKEILAITGIMIRETGYMGIGARFEITVPKEAYRFQPANSPAGEG